MPVFSNMLINQRLFKRKRRVIVPYLGHNIWYPGQIYQFQLPVNNLQRTKDKINSFMNYAYAWINRQFTDNWRMVARYQ